jgi:flagellar hook-length control protein FliK
MVGLNLLAVGAAPEAHLGDAPANAAPPSEGVDFAGVLEAMLPADALPASEESASPNADALGAQMATLGLPLLTLLPVQTPAVADRAVEPSLQPAPSADALTLYAPTTLRGYAPEPAPALGAGMGDGDFTHTLTAASENLLAVEGDAPPAAARQAEPPPPSPSTPTLDGASNSALAGAPANDSATLQNQPSPSGSPQATQPEPRLPRDEQPAGQQEPRTLTATHTTAPAQYTPHALSAAESASPLHYAEPNWNAAEQVAQHIERMVYERERNRLTVRLDPPELGVVELRIQATGGEVQAWLTAERDLTRQMLQQAQQYLREQLESRGLHLTHFDVGAQSQFQHAPREQHTRYAAQTISTRTPTATDSLLYDGRWSVWV